MYNQNILSQTGQGLLRQAASTKGAASVFTASPSGATQSLPGLNTQAVPSNPTISGGVGPPPVPSRARAEPFGWILSLIGLDAMEADSGAEGLGLQKDVGCLWRVNTRG